jgi:hypothetical protein
MGINSVNHSTSQFLSFSSTSWCKGGGIENGEEMSFGDGSGVLDDTDDRICLGCAYQHELPGKAH